MMYICKQSNSHLNYTDMNEPNMQTVNKIQVAFFEIISVVLSLVVVISFVTNL